MQAVLDGEVLEVAQPGVDGAQHRVGIGRAVDAGLARQPAALRRSTINRGEAIAAAAVEPVGLGIFVDQALEVVAAPDRPAATTSGGKWPMVTAAIRRWPGPPRPDC